PNCLLLGDRHFGVAPIICRLIDDKVPFLIRVKKGHIFRVEERLADGSYLSTIYLGKNDRVCKRPGKRVRVIRYTLDDPARCGHGEEHVLVTSLLCPKQCPAKELICLYHERWEEEIAFGEMKQTLHGGRVLRSQSPEMIRQEVWGLLLAHFVIRKLAYQAAIKNKVEPSRISFTATVNIIHLQLAEAPPGRGLRSRLMKQWLAVTIEAIRLEVLPPRRARINPRVVKKRSVACPTKYDHHRKPPRPHPDFAETIKIPI
ncbi:MAG: transposase, partial [Planctomycetota bacterium]